MPFDKTNDLRSAFLLLMKINKPISHFLNKLFRVEMLKEMDVPDNIKNDPIAIYNFKEKDQSENQKEDFNARKFVESKGGLEKMKPEDKL